MIKSIKVSELKPHPRNREFFDDIEGDKWEDFKKSIVRRGVLESIVVTQDYLVVSGHQRVRACKELGIVEVPARINTYPEKDQQTGNPKEDLIIEDLISTNIIQRGIGNVNPMKMARCIVELERIYGIYNGNHKSKDMNNSYAKSQKQLAADLGIDQTLITRYKKLNNLSPELQDLVESGEVKATTAYNVWSKLSLQDQNKFIEDIGKDRIAELTQKQTADLILEKQRLEELLSKTEQERNSLGQKLNSQVDSVKEVIVEKEVDNTDYESIRKLQDQIHKQKNELKSLTSQKDLLKERLEQEKGDADQFRKLKSELDNLHSERDDLHRQIESATSISSLVVEIEHMLMNKLAPVKYSKAIYEQSNNPVVVNNLVEIIDRVVSWATELEDLLPKNKIKNINNFEIIDVEAN